MLHLLLLFFPVFAFVVLQSRSQRDSEKVFVTKFLFGATFIHLLYIYDCKNPLSKHKAIYLV